MPQPQSWPWQRQQRATRLHGCRRRGLQHTLHFILASSVQGRLYLKQAAAVDVAQPTVCGLACNTNHIGALQFCKTCCFVMVQGRLYLKKATVVDVAQPTVCDVVVDDPRQRVNGVAQRQLESIVPKANGARVRPLTLLRWVA